MNINIGEYPKQFYSLFCCKSLRTLSLAANQSNVMYELKHWHDICDAKLEVAYAVMNLRQLDINLEEMMSDKSGFF